MTTTRARVAAISSLLFVFLMASPASAQDARAEARQHYQRALELFGEERYEGALVEFEAAYAAVPNPALLYNIGNVHAALGHAVEAVDAYEAYLRDAEGIAPDRRTEVQASLTRQRDRVGRVLVRVNVEGAIITVDGEDVGTAPLPSPIRLTLGAHLFSARARGYDQPQTRVDVSGNSDTAVELTLRESEAARGLLRVTSVPSGVTVLVAGREVGVTPLDETVVVEPGPVTVVGRRLGYVDATQAAETTNGAETSVRLELEPDVNAPPEHLGRLRVRVPEEETTLLVDGREVALGAGAVELPIGSHDLRLTVAHRQPIRQTLEIPSGGEHVFAPELSWTDDARRDQLGGADAQRTVGWVVGGVGIAAALTSAGVLAWNESLINEWEGLYPLFDGPAGCITLGQDCSREVGGDEDRRYMELERQPLNAIRATTIAGLVVGVGAATVGLVLVLTAPSAEAIDAAANVSATLRVGPGGLVLDGAF